MNNRTQVADPPLDALLDEIRSCRVCEEHLPLGPRPVVQIDAGARIAIVGQAPGIRVHKSGVPFDDPSGDRLREWMGVDKTTFYDASQIAIIPMGFCYPGKGKSGDLPPRKECAPLWHDPLFHHLPNLRLIALVGMYSQNVYLDDDKKLTERVRSWRDYGPTYFPLPHPSPRNRFWMQKNPWFEADVLPHFQQLVHHILE